MLLSNWEHLYSVRPSILLESYLVCSIAFDAVRARTYWLIHTSHAVAGLFSAALAIKIAVLLLETRSKRPYLRGNDLRLSVEQTAGMLSLGLWTWVLGFLARGYRRGLGVLGDLMTVDEALLSASFQRKSLINGLKHGPKRKYSLFQKSLHSLGWSLYAPIVPRLAMSAFTYSQPLLLTRTLGYVEGQPYTNKNIGYGLIGAYVLVYAGIAISSAQYWRYVNRLVTQMRVILIPAIYDKITTLADGKNMEAVTLMSADMERITEGLKDLHEVWACAVEAGVAFYLLYRQIGPVSVAPIGLAILSTILTSQLARLIGKRQKLWLEAVEARLKPTIRILGCMKEVKMYGIGDKIERTLQSLRINELKIARGYRRIVVLALACSYTTLTLSPVIAFGAFSAQENITGQPLDASRMFTSLSLINLLAKPLIAVLQSLPRIASAASCFARIQAFMGHEDRMDYRHFLSGRPLTTETYIPSTPSSPEIEESTDIALDTIRSEGRAVHAQQPNDKVSIPLNAFIIVNGFFGWDRVRPPVLKDINLCIPASRFTVVTGPSGSGKTTFLMSLLAETYLHSGSVEAFSTSIAVADQACWLANRTLKENITGYSTSPLDGAWYRQVLSACALDEDVRSWDKGDERVIGSKGTSLSGGQKQRVALARAIYAKKQIVILDDVLSGLDTVTETRILNRLCGADGILRRQRTTVILATHSAQALKFSDHIISLGSDGYIQHQGTFQSLEQDLNLANSSESDENQRFQKSETDWPSNEESQVHDSPPLESDETEKRNLQTSGDISVYGYYFASMGLLNVAAFLALGIAFTFFLRFSDLWVAWWSAENERKPNSRLGMYLGVYGGLQGAAIVSICLWAWLYLERAVAKSGSYLHKRVLQTVIKAPLAFLSSVDNGVTVNRFSQDILLIDGELPASLINAAAELFSGVAQLALVAVASPYICILYPFIFLAIFLLQKFYLKTSRPLRILDIEAKSPLYTHFVESLEGLPSVRAFGWEKRFRERCLALLDASQIPFYLLLSVQRWLNLVLDLMVGALAVVVVGLAVGLNGSVKTANMGVTLSNIITLGETLRELLLWFTMLEMSIGAVARVKAFAAETLPEDIDDRHGTPPDAWPASGELVFRDVSASYVPLSPSSNNNNNNTQQLALDHVTFSVPPAHHVAICGRSGSGKSSLLSTLFRLLEPLDGAIYIDGLNILDFPRETLRSRLNVVPQSSCLFVGSVRANLDPADVAADDSTLWKALQSVQLDGLVDLMGGLDAPLSASSLSHGEKELLCLARALVKKSAGGKVLVLDEATSSVDPETGALMQRVIRTEFKDHTVLMVTHRLEGVMDMDMVVVMGGGKVTEYGTPSELLKNENGEFRKLHSAQSTTF
ncbi:Putative ABC transporter protein [Macrophomina phaseolina MS6]|uniref:Putative ABC transporter protein n=1 Tax=Macrophomina phaseolina (strain MS6) TaxID=1126212 RepID=K2QWS5_MACPH|nr:Putative ABC transporter protein [Macrophomina phaseolina MS6]